jgi:hypothetical protein
MPPDPIAAPPPAESPPASPAPETPAPPENVPPAAEGTPIYAGKFKSPQELERATREIRKKLEMPDLPDGPLFGPGTPHKDVTGLATEYQGFEKLLGKTSARPAAPAVPALQPGELPAIPEPPKTPPPATPAVDDDADVDTVIAKAGLTKADLGRQWAAEGKLTEAQYAALKAQNYPRKVVDTFLASDFAIKKAAAADAVAQINTLAGGEQQRQVVLEWAGAHYPPDDPIRQDIKNPGRAVAAMKQILYDYQRRTESANSRPTVSGDPAPSAAGAPYTSLKEYSDVLARMNRGQATPEEQRRFLATNKNKLA